MDDKESIYEVMMKRYIRSANYIKDYNMYNKIHDAAQGEDAMNHVLKAIWKAKLGVLDAFDYDGSGFDVSYQGSQEELEQDIVDAFAEAGITLTDGYDANSLMYNNDGVDVEIHISSGNDDYTFTDKSNGFYISVTNIYE